MKIIKPEGLKGFSPIAIIVSQFNHEITEVLYQGALHRLKELGLSTDEITVVWVPGAVEIPIVAKRLAQTKHYQAIICLGVVIRGETSHYDYVCSQVSDGCQKVALKCDIPVIFGVLTVENEEQAWARAGGAEGNKGSDAADAAFNIISVLQRI